ncbi:bestrophin family protein [Tellurirhabdus bombi]|uniref:bestrophin family protein n=1 Tax=Tellurirhabdus bombi TaxID=2907205 RepID=UPI001F1DDEAE|nr:bestrophin family ion channel [Tellurirhabdus bombi]
MILYKKDDWWKAIWFFHTGGAARSLWKRLIAVAAYVTTITIVELRFVDLSLANTTTEYFSALGILLGLLLVFRTNTAYDRFYEGRSSWGLLVNTSRNMAAMLGGILPQEDRANRKFFAKAMSNFAFGLANHLRNMANVTELEDLEDGKEYMLHHSEHLPGAIVLQMRIRLEELYRAGVISDAQSINLNDAVMDFLNVAGVCERIKSTPIPFSYSFMIKFLITVYVIILPFSILEAYGYLTIVAVLVTSYVLVGLEIIGEEIEEPFGLERNNLPLNQLSQLIRINVHDLLQLHLPVAEKEAAHTDYVVVN